MLRTTATLPTICEIAPESQAYVFTSIGQPDATSTKGLNVNHAGTGGGGSPYTTPTVDSGWTLASGVHAKSGTADFRTNFNGIADDGTTVGIYDDDAVRVGITSTSAGSLNTLPFVSGSTNSTPLDMNSAGAGLLWLPHRQPILK
ncbi:MAG: hypothetical protein ACFCVE_06265 [Phycisphaerae bacterium]